MPKGDFNIPHYYQMTNSENDPSLVVPDSLLCKICLKEQLAVIFLPCGHIIACVSCAVTLKECAVCREKFNIILRVYIDMKKKKPSESKEDCVDPLMCKVCEKKEMSVAFAPCRHVACCILCAGKRTSCLICSVSCFGLIQVYL